MSSEKQKVEEIFKLAIQIEDQTERIAFVNGKCSNDSRLRADVESLLAALEEAGDFLEAPILGPDVMLDSTLKEEPGTFIGRYKLLEKIGEGGMATVYMAEQEQPIRRKVALKIIKLGMDTKQVIARFEVERQALAIMDHPHIANNSHATLSHILPIVPLLICCEKCKFEYCRDFIGFDDIQPYVASGSG